MQADSRQVHSSFGPSKTIQLRNVQSVTFFSLQIRRLTDSFRTRDTQMAGAATLQYEDFVGLAMGAHN